MFRGIWLVLQKMKSTQVKSMKLSELYFNCFEIFTFYSSRENTLVLVYFNNSDFLQHSVVLVTLSTKHLANNTGQFSHGGLYTKIYRLDVEKSHTWPHPPSAQSYQMLYALYHWARNRVTPKGAVLPLH